MVSTSIIISSEISLSGGILVESSRSTSNLTLRYFSNLTIASTNFILFAWQDNEKQLDLKSSADKIMVNTAFYYPGIKISSIHIYP